MAEVVRTIKFEHFRGLPDNEFVLKGKSLVLLGANGRGKSALVDGVEFLFAGQVGRFTGSGTGGIVHDEAVRHARNNGAPSVSINLSPSNKTAKRSLGADLDIPATPQGVQDYFKGHPPVDSFVLRRSRILDFINDKDADRYKKFITLLGIQQVDELQRAFVEAERLCKEDVERKSNALKRNLAVFRDPVLVFDPGNSAEILAHVTKRIEDLGCTRMTQWSEAPARLIDLKAKRPVANAARVDALTKAIVALETPLPSGGAADVALANELRQKLADLSAGVSDAPRAKVIDEGIAYLHGHLADETCPLCEQEFALPTTEILAKLNGRRDRMRELNEATGQRNAAIGRSTEYAKRVVERLQADMVHVGLLMAERKENLEKALGSAAKWQEALNEAIKVPAKDLPPPPGNVDGAGVYRKLAVGDLKTEKEALTPKDTSALESAIVLVERAVASHTSLTASEAALQTASALATRAKVANDAFTSAREAAIQKVFAGIAGTVLTYYGKLHNVSAAEVAECTALELKSTSRAAAGGLKLAIDFLGLLQAKDPRAFLSEGHLDSLGLCLFLATVKLFNPPGTILVLDDVLTSIDKDHRHRVGELLMQEFGAYQIVLTTHDEHWFNLLDSKARALGVQGKWAFQKLHGWTLDSGPSVDLVGDAWESIDEQMTEPLYRSLGGPFRWALEDFLKRTAAKIEFKVKYKYDGAYTAGDFATLGIHEQLRTKLKAVQPLEAAAIDTEIMRVFGQGNLINDLSHDNVARLEITFSQAQDFVQGLKDVTRRCEANGLIRARS